jgi:hypothetical protein
VSCSLIENLESVISVHENTGIVKEAHVKLSHSHLEQTMIAEKQARSPQGLQLVAYFQNRLYMLRSPFDLALLPF